MSDRVRVSQIDLVSDFAESRQHLIERHHIVPLWDTSRESFEQACARLEESHIEAHASYPAGLDHEHDRGLVWPGDQLLPEAAPVDVLTRRERKWHAKPVIR